MCEIFSKLTTKTPELPQWRLFSAFVVNFEQISLVAVSIVDFEQIDNGSVSWVTKFLPSKQMFKASNKGISPLQERGR